ncbi:MAG TPA: tetratricopeptide repeat protein [Nitrospiraceae bacterium]|nr:tetratricopeptide repeat protein [Nitrospiraceae bacterium]
MEADKSKVQQSANQLASRGQFDRAVAEWKKLLIDSPADGTIHNSIGDLHLKRHAVGEAIDSYFQAGAAFQAAGSALKAIAVYKKILKIDPSRYKVYQNLGDLNAERGLINNAVSDYITLSKLYLKEGLVRDALAVYRRIVNLDPANLDARRRLADLCLQEGLREEAVKTLLQLGKECSAQSRAAEAREVYQRVLKVDPGNTVAERLLINPHEALPEDRPSRSSDTAKGPDELDRQQSLDQANRHISAGQCSEADALLSELLSSHPGDPEVCRLLAMLHIKQGQLAVALSEVQFLAEAAIRAEDYALAETMVREYLAADPTCVTLLELLGTLYEQSGNPDGAVTQYGKALEVLLEHPDPETPSRPAELYGKIKVLIPTHHFVERFASVLSPMPPQQPEEPNNAQTAPSESNPITTLGDPVVQTEAVETLQSSPAQPSEQEYKTRYELGLAYKDMGLLDEAIEEFQIAAHSHECFLDSSSLLSACLKESGQHAAARECLEHAIADSRCAGDKSVALRYELGLLYEAEGAFDKAAEIFLTIPHFLDVPVRLERVQSAGGKKVSAEPAETLEPEPPTTAPSEHTTVGAGHNGATERKKRRISYL